MFNLYTWGFLRLWGEMGRFPTLRDSTPSPPPAPTLIHGAAANRVHVLARRPLISLSRTRLLYSFSSPPPLSRLGSGVAHSLSTPPRRPP